MSKLITVTLPEEQWEATIKAIEVVCQQADRIAELEKDLEGCEYFLKAQTKPLSDEEIIKLFWDASWGTDEDVVKFARAIEERHGIK